MPRSVAAHREATDVERVFREVYGQAVATLVRVFGDITLAEDAVQHAFVVASERWRSDGIPPNPAGWIITTARNRAIDDLRRSARGRELHEQLGAAASTVRSSGAGDLGEDGPVRDDQLRLIFTCCHPALRTEHQVALTLRLLGGLSVDEGPLVPGERIGNGKTARPSQIQDQGSQDPLPSARRGRTT